MRLNHRLKLLLVSTDKRLACMLLYFIILNDQFYLIGLKTEDFLERRLQTQVFKLGLAKSIHHARVLIRQKHIRVRKQVVNIPSYIVRLDAQKHIDIAINSAYGSGREGRVKRKRLRAGAGGDNDEDED